jgi:GrpB-like predicted nucleotidyltransferase (UPF0157 family)
MPGVSIRPYFHEPPACLEYDPRAAEVARRVAALITRRLPMVTVEHIGSTAVPGCAGKGVVDLMLLYPEGHLEMARETLDNLGFQRQTMGHLFPESRPMRVGAVNCRGRTFRVHVHVIEVTSGEVAALRAFRERLRADPQFAAAYVAHKQNVLATGVMDPQDYTHKKGSFVEEALGLSPDPHPAPD